MGCLPGWFFVSRVCFLGATYELGALYPFVFDAPIGFFGFIQHYLKKKLSSTNRDDGNKCILLDL